jgi:isopenicillin N synthase-like dioxygenase
MQQLLKQELEPFRTDGYLRIQLSRAAAQVVALALDAGYPFFRTPLEEKLRNVLPKDGGYRPQGIEYSRSPDQPDQIESFTVTAWTSADALPTASARKLHARMITVSHTLESVAETLMLRLAESISGRPSERLRGGFRRWSRLQLNYSRPAAVTTSFINELHEDGVLMTVTCVTGPGLEVQSRNGCMIPLVAGPNEALAMTGEIAYLLSGGVLPPLHHQVCAIADCPERMALVFLGDLEPELCDPWIENGINKDVDIGDRVRTSALRYGLQGFTPD